MGEDPWKMGESGRSRNRQLEAPIDPLQDFLVSNYKMSPELASRVVEDLRGASGTQSAPPVADPAAFKAQQELLAKRNQLLAPSVTPPPGLPPPTAAVPEESYGLTAADRAFNRRMAARPVSPDSAEQALRAKWATHSGPVSTEQLYERAKELDRIRGTGSFRPPESKPSLPSKPAKPAPLSREDLMARAKILDAERAKLSSLADRRRLIWDDLPESKRKKVR